MTIFKKLAIAAVFAATIATGAQAAPVTEYMSFDLQNSTEGTAHVYTGTYAIDSITDAVAYDVTTIFDTDPTVVPAGVAGDSFIIDFVLRIQDPQYVSFHAISTFQPAPTVQFFSVTLGDFLGGVYNPVNTINSPISLYEDGFELHSGSYAMEFTGVFLSDGGGFNGVLTTTPVPEPSSLALMLAGVGAMFSLARRRKNSRA